MSFIGPTMGEVRCKKGQPAWENAFGRRVFREKTFQVSRQFLRSFSVVCQDFPRSNERGSEKDQQVLIGIPASPTHVAERNAIPWRQIVVPFFTEEKVSWFQLVDQGADTSRARNFLPRKRSQCYTFSPLSFHRCFQYFL